MSATFRKISLLVEHRKVRVSQHAYARIMKRGILLRIIIGGIANAEALEDYPDYQVGPAVFVLQQDEAGHRKGRCRARRIGDGL